MGYTFIFSNTGQDGFQGKWTHKLKFPCIFLEMANGARSFIITLKLEYVKSSHYTQCSFFSGIISISRNPSFETSYKQRKTELL